MNTDAPVPPEPDYEFWEKIESYNSGAVAACLACDVNPDLHPSYYGLPTKPSAVFAMLEAHTHKDLLRTGVTRAELRAVVDKARLKPKLFYPELRTGRNEKPISEQQRQADLNLIGALVRLYWDETGDGTNNINQSEIIEQVIMRFKGVYGLTKRTLQTKLPAALEALKNSQAK